MKTPPNRIRELRLAAGFTIKELADAIGSSTATIQRLEVGKRALSEKWVTLISNRLGVHPGELFRKLDETPAETAEREAAELLAGMSEDDRALWLAVGRAMTAQNRTRKTG